MDALHFDALTRRLTLRLSRRRGVAILATVGLPRIVAPDAVAAKKKCPPCKKRNKQGRCKKKRPDGKSCPGGTCRQGRCCVAEPTATTCAGATCGTVRINTCGQAVTCPCPAGQTCLANGSCATPCSVSNNTPCADSADTCLCQAETTGTAYCRADLNSCLEAPQTCTTSSDCQPGEYCMPAGCGPSSSIENRCWPLCTP